MEPGTYWYFVVPPAGSNVACGTPYLTWLEFGPVGYCETDPDVCRLCSLNVCLALGGTWIPWQPHCLDAADSNCDGAINTFDIEPFILALTAGQAAWEATYHCDFFCANDCNGDGAVNTFDIEAFVQLLTGG